MTLLEVLLATAVLSAVVLLAALVLTQARTWNDDNHGHFRSMRLVRVTELMTRQWADRRSAVGVDASGGKVLIEPGRVRFVTATGVLHGGGSGGRWPLVSASYLIEKDVTTGRFALVYEEARVSSFGTAGVSTASAAQLESPATGDEEPARTVLLKNVKDLRFERYGPRLSPEERAASLERGEISTGDEDEEARRPGWHRYDSVFKGPIPAVRIVGEHDGKEFACVFVVERSR
ncbi:MAG: hypothetical protein ACKVZJ_08760 [Phycisphaerales bacterium]